MTKPIYAITKQYSGSFTSAIKAITLALKDQGFGILTDIDVQATLKKKLDVDYPAYRILGACSPANAHLALLAEKEIGLLLPCNLIVYRHNNKVYISIMKPTAVLTISSHPQIARLALKIETKLIRALNHVC